MKINGLKVNLDSKNTALLIIDMQRDFLLRKDIEDDINDLDQMVSILKPLNTFIEKCKSLNIPTIFTRYIETKGQEPNNIKQKKLTGNCVLGTQGAEIYELNTHDSLIIDKHTWDAFTNPNLNNFLVEKGIQNLIIVGVTTECCVLSTISSAFAKGYTVFVPMELVATELKKKDIHEKVLDLINLYYGFVTKSEEIISGLSMN